LYIWVIHREFTELMANDENLKEPWKKGQSGNPKGKPPGARNRRTIILEALNLLIEHVDPVTGEKVKMKAVDAISYAMLEKAKQGDVNAFKELMDSGFGKLKDVQESTVINSTPLTPEEIKNIDKKLDDEI
jgi:hypothetical protein